MRRLALIGWLIQPLYIVAELAVALAAPASYSIAHDSISALGATDMPHDAWINGAFVVFGAGVAIGAWNLQRVGGASRATTFTAVLFLVSGIGSIGVGLAPLDTQRGWHAATAIPIFLARPIVLGISAVALREHHRSLARATWGVAALTLVGVVGFAVAQQAGTAEGALERLALWPADVWFACIAVAGFSRMNARDVR